MAGGFRDPMMHAPCYDSAHTLPSAGDRHPNNPREVFRYNRVIPHFVQDPCVRPNEGDLMCPPECNMEIRNDMLPSAGAPSDIGDVFRFYSVRKPKEDPSCFGEDKAYLPCSSLGGIQDVQECPCINRSNGSNGHSSHFANQKKTNQGGAAWAHMRASQYREQAGTNISMLHRGTNATPLNTLQPMQQHGYNEDHGDFPRGRMEADHGNSPFGRDGARAPSPHSMSRQGKIVHLDAHAGPEYSCQHPYIKAPYICRPVFNRKYLLDCPEQDGPPPDTYTFL